MAMTSLLPSVVVVVVMMNCNGNKIGKLSDRHHQRWSAMKVVMN
jgi:hypothetical protein